MRDFQIALEEMNMKQTSISGFMENFEGNRDEDVLVKLIQLVESGVDKYINSVVRKRASFFKVVKGLSSEEIAYVGLKGLLGTMAVTQSMAVTSVGQRIGDALFVATGREDELYSIEEKVLVEKTGAGIKLLDIVIRSLPKSYFRTECERSSKKITTWVVVVGSGYDKLRRENSQILSSFSKRMSPLISPPDDWSDMVGGGYLTPTAKKIAPLVKRSPHHRLPEGDTIFSAINHIQKTPFRVHKEIFSICKQLQVDKPQEMKKVFMEDLGKFTEACPIDQEVDAYLWEKVEKVEINETTGREKITSVMAHEDPDSKAKRKEFFKWAAKKALHKKRMIARDSLSKSFTTTLEVTEKLKSFDEVYWAYQLCRRSRVYPSAMTGINLQGADYQKAVVEFSVGLPLTDDDGVYALIKTLCNHWGKDNGSGVKTDKLTRSQGELWVGENTRWIQHCAENPLDNKKWMDASKPLQFLAACLEWKGWNDYRAKNPSSYNYISHICDPNDASCSGAQILSAMTRDMVGAKHTNLLNMEVQDLYMAVASKVTDNLLLDFSNPMCQDWLGRNNVLDAIRLVIKGETHEVLTTASHREILRLWDEGVVEEDIYLKIYLKLTRLEQDRLSNVIRDLVKKPVMVKFYSGTRYGNIEHCSEFIVGNNWENYFRCDGTGKAAAFMGSMIFDSINQVVVGAGLVMEWFIHVAEVLGKKNKPVKWTTPAGFKASMVKYATKDVKLKVSWKDSETRFTIKVPKIIVTKDGWEYKLDVKKMKSGIAPDIVHSFDAALIIKVAERCAKEGIHNLWLVHDSLASHCCLSLRFNRIIREEFVALFKEDILQKMYEEFQSQLEEKDQGLILSPEEFGIIKGDYILEDILDSEFSFH